MNALNCEISKQTWPCHNLKRTKAILSRRKSDVKTLFDVLTGHCLIGIHAKIMGRYFYDYCGSCQQPEADKILNIYSVTVQHIIERGMICWENYILSNLSDIVATDLRAIPLFVRRSKWFCHEKFEE